MTAPLALRLLRAAHVQPGETILVQAAAGGVGHLVVQLAKLFGLTVIGTASSSIKLNFVGTCGADVAIDYSTPGWPEEVRAAAPRGIDIVLDAVGGDVFSRGIDLLAPLGRMVTYGAISGEPPTVSALSLVALKSVAGLSITAWRSVRPEEARADINEVAEYFAAGRLHAAVHAVLPLEDIISAHEILDKRANLGRVVSTT